MTSKKKSRWKLKRRGAVLPLFAFLLPVIFIMCGLAINIAHMRLTKTEMKIATDAAAHAGGRSMSIHQTTDDAINWAKTAASWNYVNGQALALADEQIVFCSTTRLNNGWGRYSLTEKSKESIDNGTENATSLRVYGQQDVPLLVRAIPGVSTYDTHIYSSATQVDRDIALVLDRSGSMLFFQDEGALAQALSDLLNNVNLVPYGHWETRSVLVGTETYQHLVGWETTYETVYYDYWQHITKPWRIRYSAPTRNAWRWEKKQGSYQDEINTPIYEERTRDVYEDQQFWVEDGVREEPNPLITQSEYDAATDSLYDRTYTQNVVNQLATINADMSEYAQYWRNNNSGNTGNAPPHSRWALLSAGVDAFLNVLDGTDQEEQVALITFNSSSYHESDLSKNFNTIRTKMDTIQPYSGTAIHYGLNIAKTPILTGPNARPFAAKTIIVLTDGQNNDGSVNLGTFTRDLIGSDNVTVHSMTFTPGAAQQPMIDVATYGRGKHYHADDGANLISDFEEIANNLPTILTE